MPTEGDTKVDEKAIKPVILSCQICGNYLMDIHSATPTFNKILCRKNDCKNYHHIWVDKNKENGRTRITYEIEAKNYESTGENASYERDRIVERCQCCGHFLTEGTSDKNNETYNKIKCNQSECRNYIHVWLGKNKETGRVKIVYEIEPKQNSIKM